MPSNNELAMQRTELAQQRTGLAEQRTGMSTRRTDMAVERTDLAEIRTELARERTLMAWIRTELSMISFGFGIDRLFKYLDKTEVGAGVNVLTEERVLGLSLMSLGLFTLVAALKNIETQEYKYTPG